MQVKTALPAGTALSSKPTAAAACGKRTMGQTDRRTDRWTPDSFNDTASRATQALPING